MGENGNYGALFYSEFNHPYNIYQSFTNDFISLIGNGYVLEFWFMIDNVIFNQEKFFKDPTDPNNPNKRFYYFYSNLIILSQSALIFKFKRISLNIS